MKLHIPSKTIHAFMMKSIFGVKTEDLIKAFQETTNKTESEIKSTIEDIKLNSDHGFSFLQGSGNEDFVIPSQFNSEYIARLKYRIKELEDEKAILQEQLDINQS